MRWRPVVGKVPYLNVDDDYESDPHVLLKAEARNAYLLRRDWGRATFREDALQTARLKHLCPFCLGWIAFGDEVAVLSFGVVLNQPDPSILADGKFDLPDGTTVRVNRLYRHAHPACARGHCRALNSTDEDDDVAPAEQGANDREAGRDFDHAVHAADVFKRLRES